jgi:putative Ca2+/H+ antiporter (TMEM165/GDT1 family)
MSLTIAATVFAIVFLAELPDKTALASLVLGATYRPSWVLAGVAAAFTVHVGIALAAGNLLALLPHRVLSGVVAAVFLLGAVLLLRRGDEESAEENRRLAATASFSKVAATAFVTVFIAEFGDLTQIVTANLAARYHEPLAVGLGALLALWAVATLAVYGGRGLLRIIPMHWVIRLAALIMVVMAGFSLVDAITG